MDKSEGLLSVFTEGQSYRNMLYLLLSFPLGIVYFVFLVTGLSLGFSLIIIGIGIPILLIMFVLSRGMIEFECQLSNKLLGVDIQPHSCENVKGQKILEKLNSRLHDPSIWKGIVYLFAKFPLGIFSFAVSIALITLTLGLITAPLTYHFVPITIGFYRLNTLSEALAALFLGVGVGLISLRAMNGLAFLMGRYAIKMLKSPQQDEIHFKLTEM